MEVWSALGAIALLLGALYWLQHRLLFSPTHYRDEELLRELASSLQPFELVVEDNIRLEGMVYEAAEPKMTVLYFGGKEQDGIATMARLAKIFDDLRIVTFNYRGYGQSKGRVSEESIKGDALAVYEWAYSRYGSCSVMGYSLGGFAAAYVASRREVVSVILVNAFDAVSALIQKKYHLPKFLSRYAFDTLHCVKSIEEPLYLYVCSDDEIVPLEHSRNLKTNVRNLAGYKEFSGYNHNELLLSDELALELNKVFNR